MRYTLSREQRDRLDPDVDVQALEQFLGSLPDGERGDALSEFFLARQSENNEHRVTVGVRNNETLEMLLGRVWAPRRARLAQDEGFWRTARRNEMQLRPVLVALVVDVGVESAVAAIRYEPSESGRDVIFLSEPVAAAESLFRCMYKLISLRRSTHDGQAPVTLFLRGDDLQGLLDDDALQLMASRYELLRLRDRIKTLRVGSCEFVREADLADASWFEVSSNMNGDSYPIWDPRWTPRGGSSP